MVEKIYTIPINEAFDACGGNPSEGCPFCRLAAMLENNELELILGASMMESDVRIKTNELGFCRRHFNNMFERKNRLGLGLILESHLDELRTQLDRGGIAALTKGSGTLALERLDKLNKTCYVCGRIEHSFNKMLSNATWLWESEPEFRSKTKTQPYFCLNHLGRWLENAKINMPKKLFEGFYIDLSKVVYTYLDELKSDVSWFCKKFDYRYESEPWGNSKDAIERAIRFLNGI